jgi:hypothetical protein
MNQFITEWKAKFQLHFSANNVVIFILIQVQGPLEVIRRSP